MMKPLQAVKTHNLMGIYHPDILLGTSSLGSEWNRHGAKITSEIY